MISFYYIIRDGVKESELQSKWNNSVQTHYVLAQVTFLNNIFWCASLIYKHRLPASKINNQADDFFWFSLFNQLGSFTNEQNKTECVPLDFLFCSLLICCCRFLSFFYFCFHAIEIKNDKKRRRRRREQNNNSEISI